MATGRHHRRPQSGGGDWPRKSRFPCGNQVATGPPSRRVLRLFSAPFNLAVSDRAGDGDQALSQHRRHDLLAQAQGVSLQDRRLGWLRGGERGAARMPRPAQDWYDIGPKDLGRGAGSPVNTGDTDIGAPGFEPGTSPTRITGETPGRCKKYLQIDGSRRWLTPLRSSDIAVDCRGLGSEIDLLPNARGGLASPAAGPSHGLQHMDGTDQTHSPG